MFKCELPYIVLAYLGDAVFEMRIREFFIRKGCFSDVHLLHKKVVSVVNGRNQDRFLRTLKESDFLSEDELDLVRRVRNHKESGRKASERESTAFEALVGYLYRNDPERLERLFEEVEERIDE